MTALLNIPECTTLKKIREGKGLTQAELCLRSAIGSQQISSFERGEKIAWPKARSAIAKALKISERNLFPEYYPNAQTLQSKRKQYGFTRNQLAKLAGLTTKDIEEVEKGLRSPTEKEKRRLAQIFGTSIDDLFPEFSQNTI